MVDYKSLTDRELLTGIKEAPTSSHEFQILNRELFRRYEKQIHKNWQRLLNQLSRSSVITSLKEEYYSEAYEAFYKAVLAINLNKIKDDKWKFVGYLDWYLKNVRTNVLVRAGEMGKENSLDSALEEDSDMALDRIVDYRNWERSEVTDDPADIVAERDLAEKRKALVEKVSMNWNEQTKLVYKLWEYGYKKVEIANILGMKDSEIYTLTDKIKRDLQKRAALEGID